MTELERLEAKRNKFIKAGKFAQAAVIDNQIRLARVEIKPLKSLLPEMDKDQRKEALRLMHKTFIYSDMMESSVIEFENYLNKVGGDLSLLLTAEIKEIAKKSRALLKLVDDIGDEKLSEDFGNMCDECNLVVSNVINNYNAKRQSI